MHIMAWIQRNVTMTSEYIWKFISNAVNSIFYPIAFINSSTRLFSVRELGFIEYYVGTLTQQQTE